MVAFAGLFGVVAAVLAVGGAFKLVQPGPTAAMFGSLGLPASPVLARASGLVEVLVGSAAFLFGGLVLELGVAVLFVAFAVITLRLIQLGDAARSCGCFGRLSSPPTAIHAIINAVAAVIAAVCALTDTPGFIDARPELDLAGVPYLLMVALGTWLVIAALTVLPDTLVAARRGPATPTAQSFEVTSVR